jgi:glucoamylase
LHAGSVWDMPSQPVQRYQVEKRTSEFQIWTPKQERGWIDYGQDLRIDLEQPGTVSWKIGDEKFEVSTIDSGLGIYFALLPTREVAVGSKIWGHVRCKSSSSMPDKFTVQVRTAKLHK